MYNSLVYFDIYDSSRIYDACQFYLDSSIGNYETLKTS